MVFFRETPLVSSMLNDYLCETACFNIIKLVLIIIIICSCSSSSIDNVVVAFIITFIDERNVI